MDVLVRLLLHASLLFNVVHPKQIALYIPPAHGQPPQPVILNIPDAEPGVTVGSALNALKALHMKYKHAVLCEGSLPMPPDRMLPEGDTIPSHSRVIVISYQQAFGAYACHQETLQSILQRVFGPESSDLAIRGKPDLSTALPDTEFMLSVVSKKPLGIFAQFPDDTVVCPGHPKPAQDYDQRNRYIIIGDRHGLRIVGLCEQETYQTILARLYPEHQGELKIVAVGDLNTKIEVAEKTKLLEPTSKLEEKRPLPVYSPAIDFYYEAAKADGSGYTGVVAGKQLQAASGRMVPLTAARLRRIIAAQHRSFFSRTLFPDYPVCCAATSNKAVQECRDDTRLASFGGLQSIHTLLHIQLDAESITLMTCPDATIGQVSRQLARAKGRNPASTRVAYCVGVFSCEYREPDNPLDSYRNYQNNLGWMYARFVGAVSEAGQEEGRLMPADPPHEGQAVNEEDPIAKLDLTLEQQERVEKLEGLELKLPPKPKPASIPSAKEPEDKGPIQPQETVDLVSAKPAGHTPSSHPTEPASPHVQHQYDEDGVGDRSGVLLGQKRSIVGTPSMLAVLGIAAVAGSATFLYLSHQQPHHDEYRTNQLI